MDLFQKFVILFELLVQEYTLDTIVVRNRLDLFGVIVKNNASNITFVIARNDIQRLSGLEMYLLVRLRNKDEIKL